MVAQCGAVPIFTVLCERGGGFDVRLERYEVGRLLIESSLSVTDAAIDR